MHFSMMLTREEHERLTEAAGDLTLTAFVRSQVKPLREIGGECARRMSKRRGLGKNFNRDQELKRIGI